MPRNKFALNLKNMYNFYMNIIHAISSSPRYILIISVSIFYTLLSIFFFGYPVLTHITNYYIGGGIDPAQYIWSFEWVKYCVLHLKNPLSTPFMWSPLNFNLTGSTAVLGIAFLFTPLTILLGPVESSNIAMILLPAMASLTMFVLLKFLTGKILPSILGGYIFGFSTYMINQMSSHMHLVPVFLIPLFIYLFLLKTRNLISPGKFIILFTLMLVFQFLFSLEIFATFTFFGFISFLIFYFICGKTQTQSLTENLKINDVNTNSLKLELLKTLKMVIISYIIAAVVLSPYLYSYFLYGRFNVVHFAPADFSSNLLNFFIPSRYTLLGGRFFNFISKKFDSYDYVFDQDAYIGIPFIAIIIFYFYKNYRKPAIKALFYCFLIITVFSIGPTLHIYKYSIMPMPYKPFVVVPLIKHALPARFMLYSFFILSIITALFLSKSNSFYNETHDIHGSALKYAAVLLGIAFLLPSFNYGGRYTNPNVPSFFNYSYKKFIEKGENILIIPYGYNGLTDYYQAIDNLYYKTASGYLGATPAYFSNYPVVHTFYKAEPIPFSKAELCNFLYKNRVGKIIIVPPANRYYFKLFEKLNEKPLYVGGVYVFGVPQSIVSKYKNLKIKITKPILKEYYFDLLLGGAAKFTKKHNPKTISPELLEKLGYIPRFFGTANKKGKFSRYYTAQDSWIGPFLNAGAIGIGGSYKNISLIIKKYKKYAIKIYFPYPLVYNNSKEGNGLLLMVFNTVSLKKLLKIKK